MSRILMSRAATGLLRSLLTRADDDADRILLSDARSIDWQSLTFVGERHVLELRICGPSPGDVARRLIDGIGDHEFAIPGQVVADIEARWVTGGAASSPVLVIEALTLVQD